MDPLFRSTFDGTISVENVYVPSPLGPPYQSPYTKPVCFHKSCTRAVPVGLWTSTLGGEDERNMDVIK
ncbi:unnamed protein product, partial [Iphiclides podalirius]